MNALRPRSPAVGPVPMTSAPAPHAGAMQEPRRHSRLPIHNNMSELALRREAVGRKNWLFVGSDDGGAVNATFTSLLASAQLCKIEPWAYLRDLFCLLSNWPAHQMLDLAPLNWAQTSARKDVRALLAANKFRDLTIDAG
jgi:transposase